MVSSWFCIFLSLACRAVSIKTFSGELFLSLCFDLTLSLTLSQLQAVSQCHGIAVVFEELEHKYHNTYSHLN